MYEATTKAFTEADGAIMCAAVADFTPAEVAANKLKRGEEDLTITLQPTQDIAAALGKLKQPHQCLVGFALETDQEEKNAQSKLARKNLDFIVLNSLNDKGAGFQHDTNQISIIDATTTTHYPLKSKQEVAQDIVNRLVEIMA